MDTYIHTYIVDIGYGKYPRVFTLKNTYLHTYPVLWSVDILKLKK